MVSRYCTSHLPKGLGLGSGFRVPTLHMRGGLMSKAPLPSSLSAIPAGVEAAEPKANLACPPGLVSFHAPLAKLSL